VLSARRHRGGEGIDYALADAVARSIGAKLEVVWYESEYELENDPVDEVNAFMSYGLCQLAASVPLVTGILKQGAGKAVRLPRYRHMLDRDIGKVVDLGPLIASAPYRSTRFVVVLSPNARSLQVNTLADLEGKRILAEEGTVAGAIVMQYHGGILRNSVDLVAPGPKTLWLLERGKHDAAFIELDKYDNHRKQNRISKLTLSGYEHSIRFNIAFVSIPRYRDLIAQVDAVIAAGLHDGAIARMSKRAGVTYRAPVKPRMRGGVSFIELAKD
jgi:hypothetical protein